GHRSASRPSVRAVFDGTFAGKPARVATATAKRSRRRSSSLRGRVKRLVDLWVRLFSDDDLLTAATAIGFRMLIALVPLSLLGLALLGVTGSEHVWNDTIGPPPRPRGDPPSSR